MPETSVKSPTGEIIKVMHPEGASDSDIMNFAKQNYQPKTGMQYAEDIGRSVAAAPRKVVEGLAGLPGLGQRGVDAAMDYVTGKPVADIYGGEKNIPGRTLLPSSQDIQEQTSKVLGPSYQPQTTPGKYAGAITEGVTGAMMGPGGLMAKIAMGVGAGTGSEFAGEQTQGSRYEIPARILGGLSGGLAGILSGKAVAGVRNYSAAKSTGAEIGDIIGGGQVSPGAVKRLGGDVSADQITPQTAQATSTALGPEARLLDVGRQLEQRGAVGLTRIPGQAQSEILNAVEGRTGQLLPTGKYEPGAASAARLKTDFDTAMGTPVHNMVDLQKQIHDTYHLPTQAAYKQVMGDYQNLTIPAQIAERPALQYAMSGANELAHNYGVTPRPGSLEYWDYVKKGLDQRINSMIRNGTDSVGKADLGGLLAAKRDLVTHLDTVTGGQYATARRLSATEKGMTEAADFGPVMFNNKVLPEVVKQQFDDLSLAEQAVAKASIRRELDRQMGSVTNDASKAKAIFGQNNVLAKTEALFGPDAAQMIKTSVDREHAFQNTTNVATKQSITSLAKNVTDEMRDVPQHIQMPTLYGALTSIPRSGVQYMHGQGMERTRQDMARVLLAKQNEISPVVELLGRYNTKAASNAATPAGAQTKALIRALMAQGVGGQ